MTKPATDKPKRVSLDNPEVVAELCARISEGRGIYDVCSDRDMPSKTEVYRRLGVDETFGTKIARARQAQQDALVDQMREKAATADATNWQAIRLQIWTDQWCAARLAPRRYGDRTRHEHGGPDGGVIPISFAAMSDAQLEGFIQRLEGYVGAHGGGAAPDEGD